MKTKDKVLQILLNAGENSVSGEDIAKGCGVSRAAVWKAINSLREDGINICGTNNKGYAILKSGDVFSENIVQSQIRNSLQEKGCFSDTDDFYIKTFKTIDSTNTYCKKLLLENSKIKNGIIVAQEQTGGRGRLGRSFLCPAETGIYFSIICTPRYPVTKPAEITACAAVALCMAIEKLFGVEPGIKWINDIFVNGKKAAGILTEGFSNLETGTVDSVIVGTGVNIYDNKNLPKVAGSICGSSKSSVSRASLVAEAVSLFFYLLNHDSGNILTDYKKRSFLIGKKVQVHSLPGAFSDSNKDCYPAEVLDIDDSYSLVVKLNDGTVKSLFSGEVSLGSDTTIS